MIRSLILACGIFVPSMVVYLLRLCVCVCDLQGALNDDEFMFGTTILGTFVTGFVEAAYF